MVVAFNMSTGERDFDDFEAGNGYSDAHQLSDRIRLKSEGRYARQLELRSVIPSDLRYDVDALLSTLSSDSWD
jgi:hypothetical protein